MSLSECYHINSPTVINETIEEESVIINLSDGFYYSLDNVGSLIWDAINTKTPVSDIIETMKAQFSGDSVVIEEEVKNLIRELEKENLIVPEANDNKPETIAPSAQKKAFEKPVLNKFGDMQDLLLLDPIHEVDEKGWPYSDNQTPEKKPE